MNRMLLLLTTAVMLSGAEPALTDWRELWYRESFERWRAKPLPEVRKEASEGNAVAMYHLFQRLYDAREREEAYQWEKKAAEAGLPQAIISVEIKKYSADVETVKRNLPILERVAKTGYPEAEIRLAEILSQGGPTKP